MQLSVVILNYNVRYFLEQCLDSVQKALHGIDGEIIVVDNASPDDSCAMVREKFPNVILIENHENAGFPKGNNMGVARAQGEYLCILNPDTVVGEDTFQKLLAFAAPKRNLGIVGCRLIDGTGRFLPESKRGLPTPWVAFTKVMGLYKLGKAFGKYYAMHLSDDETGRVDILVGAFMLLKTSVYREVGGFDEGCFMYSDDIDLSYMVQKTGRDNYFFADTTVIHYKGESTVRDGLYMQRFRQAMDFFYRKHFRRSLFFDAALRMGAAFFSVVKKNQAVDKERPPTGYVLTPANEALAGALQNTVGQRVAPLHPVDLSRVASAGTEVFFDAAHIGYRQIMELMQEQKDEKYTFKIAHAPRGFALGSNSSNDRGKVLYFAAQR